MNKIPYEMSLYIFKYLELIDLIILRDVSIKWTLSIDEYLKGKVILIDQITEPNYDKYQIYRYFKLYGTNDNRSIKRFKIGSTSIASTLLIKLKNILINSLIITDFRVLRILNLIKSFTELKHLELINKSEMDSIFQSVILKEKGIKLSFENLNRLNLLRGPLSDDGLQFTIDKTT